MAEIGTVARTSVHNGQRGSKRDHIIWQTPYIEKRISWSEDDARPNHCGIGADFANRSLCEPFGPHIRDTAVWIRSDCTKMNQLCANIFRHSCYIFSPFPLDVVEVTGFPWAFHTVLGNHSAKPEPACVPCMIPTKETTTSAPSKAGARVLGLVISTGTAGSRFSAYTPCSMRDAWTISGFREEI